MNKHNGISIANDMVKPTFFPNLTRFWVCEKAISFCQCIWTRRHSISDRSRTFLELLHSVTQF